MRIIPINQDLSPSNPIEVEVKEVKGDEITVSTNNYTLHFNKAMVEMNGSFKVYRLAYFLCGVPDVNISATFRLIEEEKDVLKNVKPKFDGMKFNYDVSLDVLEKWSQLGVLKPKFLDRVQVCPKCKSIPSIRRGCGKCYSANLTCEELIHHFSCAYVGLMKDFVCPKCRTKSLMVGSDYEIVYGPYKCQDCNWQSVNCEQIGKCLGCNNVFPLKEAEEESLVEYIL